MKSVYSWGMEKSTTPTPKGRIPVDPDIHDRLREIALRRRSTIYQVAARILRAGLGRLT